MRAKTTRAARARRDVGEFARDALRTTAINFLAQEMREISCCETGRATLPEVGKFVTEQKVCLVRRRQRPCLVAKVFHRRLDQTLSAPMQSSEQNLNLIDILPG